MINYFAHISNGKMFLWCYLIWYLVTVYYYFDPSVRIWLNSIGISILIGIALILSVSRPHDSKPDYWQVFRLFMMPFCVSSFSSLIKGQGYLFIIPPKPTQQLVSIGSCLVFVAFVVLIKKIYRKSHNG